MRWNFLTLTVVILDFLLVISVYKVIEEKLRTFRGTLLDTKLSIRTEAPKQEPII